MALLILEAWKEDGLIEEYRTAFLKMLVMSVRNVRKYAPHSEQKDVTRTVCRVLREEGLYRPQEDDGRLTAREAQIAEILAGRKVRTGLFLLLEEDAQESASAVPPLILPASSDEKE